jgi:hypothetical protein
MKNIQHRGNGNFMGVWWALIPMKEKKTITPVVKLVSFHISFTNKAG